VSLLRSRDDLDDGHARELALQKLSLLFSYRARSLCSYAGIAQTEAGGGGDVHAGPEGGAVELALRAGHVLHTVPKNCVPFQTLHTNNQRYKQKTNKPVLCSAAVKRPYCAALLLARSKSLFYFWRSRQQKILVLGTLFDFDTTSDIQIASKQPTKQSYHACEMLFGAELHEMRSVAGHDPVQHGERERMNIRLPKQVINYCSTA
jgi:hypothetical protein